MSAVINFEFPDQTIQNGKIKRIEYLWIPNFFFQFFRSDFYPTLIQYFRYRTLILSKRKFSNYSKQIKIHYKVADKCNQEQNPRYTAIMRARLKLKIVYKLGTINLLR